MHGFSRRVDAIDQHIEEGAVLQDFRSVAGDRRAQGQARERRYQRVDGRVTLDV
jgi:hypothetical protein